MDANEAQRRTERLARLRRLGLHRGAGHVALRAVAELPVPPDSAVDAGDQPALPGEPRETRFGPAWVREERYPVEDHPALLQWLQTDPGCLAALDRNPGLAAMEPAEVAFVDTETTGLSLGAGTYTFLIGIGMFERPPAVSDASIPFRPALAGPASRPSVVNFRPGAYDGWQFVVRQIFMRNPGEERAQLHLVEELLGQCTAIVSFNGRGFDMPLINNRFILAQMPLPLPGAPHLDLLPAARRLYRLRWGACNLTALERNVLGLQRSAEDVPGYLIPDIYRQYYLTDVVSDMLVRVFYHNLQDVVSMALLGARMARCFRLDSLESLVTELDPLECLSLGRCYDALNWTEAEIVVYRAAATSALSLEHQVIALRELALLYKRLEQRDAAAALWEECVTRAGSEDLTPYVELAKHHEWHTEDLDAARGWAGWALNIAHGLAPGLARDQWVSELERRVARIEAKLARKG